MNQTPETTNLRITNLIQLCTQLCEQNKDLKLSVTMHEVEFKDIPESFIKEGHVRADGSVYGSAKSSDSSFNVTIFFK